MAKKKIRFRQEEILIDPNKLSAEELKEYFAFQQIVLQDVAKSAKMNNTKIRVDIVYSEQKDE